MKHFAALVCAAAISSLTTADQSPISIDSSFDDWASVPLAWTDPLGDGGGGVDFTTLHIADDERFLFLRLGLTQDLDLSENNALRIYLDTDDNAATGLPIGGLGAELEWRAGDRMGVYFAVGGGSQTIFHDDIRFRSAPTVTSTDFEIAIGRDTTPDGSNPLFLGTTVRVHIVDDAGGDVMPGAGSSIAYTLDVGAAPTPSPRTLGRQDANDLRVVTHNVLSDNLFDSAFESSFERLYTAVSPDIFHLQEIYGATSTETANLIASWLGGTWHGAAVNDCKTVSRFPIVDSWAIDGNLAVLIDTTAAIGSQLLCVNAHLPCCANESGRQDEVDAIIAFIREAYEPGGVVTLSSDVPVMIAGDLNLVGLSQQLETLVTGDIVDESTYGPDAAPDPDGTDLVNLKSRQTEKRMGYTWRNDNSSFWPGQLDFLIYSDSNLSVAHDFIVYTPEMSPSARAANGLLANDSLASDHLIFAADFRAPCTADLDGDGIVGFADVLNLIASWGPCACSADLNGSGSVDFADLLILIGVWGPCS